MSRSVFRRVAAPAAQATLPINAHATWYTWSDPFRRFLREAASDLGLLSKPPLVYVSELNDYDQTFSWPPTKWTDARLRGQFSDFAQSLYATRPHRRLMLFNALIDEDLDAKRLHALFALLRGTMIRLARDRRAARYSPLGKQEGDFPLHADLYVPRILFNVFNKLPSNQSGASLFFPVAALRELVASIGSLPAAQGRRIVATLREESGTDRFDVLYDLMHGEHKWVPHLEAAMKRRQFRIKLGSGQGYLLDDRAWLHGREAPQGGVPANRVHRLVSACRRRNTRRCRWLGSTAWRGDKQEGD
jgi:hypothetical protein